MISCVRTDSTNEHFIQLVRKLDADLAIRDGDDHPFYDQFNKIDNIKYVIVAYEDDIPVGCGAIKEYAEGIMEVKRMYVEEAKRGSGIGSVILAALEQWARELKYHTCLLETGKAQPEAIGLYLKNGYTIIPNYGQYAGVENSVCFEKRVGE